MSPSQLQGHPWAAVLGSVKQKMWDTHVLYCPMELCSSSGGIDIPSPRPYPVESEPLRSYAWEIATWVYFDMGIKSV